MMATVTVWWVLATLTVGGQASFSGPQPTERACELLGAATGMMYERLKEAALDPAPIATVCIRMEEPRSNSEESAP